MVGTNNFVVFDPAYTNLMSDSAYDTNASVLSGYTTGMADPTVDSKVAHQSTMMAAVIAQFMANQGYNVSDTDFNTLLSIVTNSFASISYVNAALGRISVYNPVTNPATYI